MKKTCITDETLMAFVDGELDPIGAAAVEEAMRANPEVASAVEAARALRERVGAAYASVLHEPVPARLLAAASAAPSVPRHISRRRGSPRATFAPGRRWLQLSAIAASLALGVMIAPWLRPEAPSMLDATGSSLIAGGDLAQALQSRLASDGANAGPVSVGLSFRASDGSFCRTFVLARPHSMAGLACRDAGQWHISALSEAAPEGGQLRLASSSLPPAILAEVDARLDGESLDAEGERAARRAGWE